MATIRRRDPRIGLWIPLRAQGHDASGKPWEELTKSLDASARGVAFVVKHPVEVGQLLQVTLPLPRQLRSYDHEAATYRTYAVVVSAVKVAAGSRVGAAFLGKQPPQSSTDNPAARVLKERRRGKRGALLLKVHLHFDQPQDGVRQETTVLEDFSAHGAKVQSRHQPKAGQTLEIDESEGVFRARAEVRGSYVGADGVRRLHLRFLPPPAPRRR
jgi:PilZ domain